VDSNSVRLLPAKESRIGLEKQRSRAFRDISEKASRERKARRMNSPEIKNPKLLAVLDYHREDKFDDWPEREAGIRLFNQLLPKTKFISFSSSQPSVDIVSNEGDVSVEVELNKRWVDPNYPYQWLRVPMRKGEPGGLRDISLGKAITIVGTDSSWTWKDAYYCQLSINYLHAAVVPKKVLVKYLTEEHLRPLDNSRTNDYRNGDMFYWIPLSEVQFVNIDWS
jgi:hypothetical protein